MTKLFEIFKTQKDVEGSIPKINVESKGQQGLNFSQLDSKKISFSYTMLLFVSMMIVIGLVIVYLIGYIKSESNNLSNMLALQKSNQKVNNKKLAEQTVVSVPTAVSAKPSVVHRVHVDNNQMANSNESSNKKQLTTSGISGKSSSYHVELYYGKLKPDEKFMDNLKKVVKRNLNIDIDLESNKKGKIFYIIVTSLNTENEANKVIELLKMKKMIGKNSAKVVNQLVSNQRSGE